MSNILRNITPAVAVMVAGLAGAYLVYDNFFTAQNSADTIAAISPAAGDMGEDIIIAESTIPVAEGTVAVETTPIATSTEVAADGTVTTTTTDVTTTTTEVAVPPVPAPDCTTLETAATAAMGTVDAEKTQKALTECLAVKAAVNAEGAADAAAVATDAAAAADVSAQTAVEAAVDADAAATEAKDAAAAAKEVAPAVDGHSAH